MPALDWLHFIVLLGAVQGIFLTAALAAKRTNRTANRLLAATMLTFSLGLANSVYLSAGLEQRYPHFFGVAYPLPFLYGPLLYLYALAASDRTWRLQRLGVLHFAPTLAVLAWGFPIYLLSGPDKLALYDQMRAGNLPLVVRVADPLKFVSGIGYTIATIMFLRRHSERVKESYSSVERVNLRWLLWLGVSGAAIWALATVLNVLDSSGVVSIPSTDDYVSLAVALLVYGIGYKGMRQPEVFRFETAEFPVPAAARPAPAPVVVTVTTTDDAEARYERSGLAENEAKRLKESLLAAMDRDKPWKNSELTLADLAELLKTTTHKLSEVLNSQVGETFYDFVNGYRVREVQRRIDAGDAAGLKILSLALDAGFASKSTFNQVFKKHTSQTPSDYRQKAGV